MVYLSGLIIVIDTAHHVFSKVPHILSVCLHDFAIAVLGLVEQADLDWCSAAHELCFALCVGAASQRPIMLANFVVH